MKTLGKNNSEFEDHLVKARDGNSYSQSWVGYAYDNGVGVKTDLRQAVKWQMIAAKNGEAYSQAWLGWAFQDGLFIMEWA